MGYVRLLRRRRVLALWGAQGLSVFGDRLYAMAIMWLAWEKSGAAAMGLAAVAESVPYIVMGTVGRRLMDRFASLRALAAVDASRIVLVALLPVAWSVFGLPGMLVLAVAVGVAGALFDPNLGALVPDLVRPSEVQAVYGLMDLTGRVARIAGPGAAGVLLAAMPQSALFWLDAATFAVSAAVLARLGRGVHKTAPTGKRPAVPETLSVRGLARSHPATGAAIGVHGVAIFAQAVALALPALLATMGAGAGAYGLILATTGAGALAGNLSRRARPPPGPAPRRVLRGVGRVRATPRLQRPRLEPAGPPGARRRDRVRGPVLRHHPADPPRRFPRRAAPPPDVAGPHGHPHRRDGVDARRPSCRGRIAHGRVPDRRAHHVAVAGIGAAAAWWWTRDEGLRVPQPEPEMSRD
ncbi:MFS transporter [Actinacidiphila glaucinigra]|uniref:MFS transporter n=1 Tax=Actinacidiphila glaucinigra TaxID=235986 RepID=UPI003251FE64